MTDFEIYQPARGDRVIATLYHSDGETVAGTYVPREDHRDAALPEGAALVDNGDPQGPLMVDAASVRPNLDAMAAEEEAAVHRRDLRAVRDAAQHLADTVRAAIARDLTGVARVQLPTIPRLQLPSFLGAAYVEPEEEVNKQHLQVEVRTVPVRGESAQEHIYRDEHGLSWQTYGQDHDFSTDRLLEIQNRDGDVVASYPAGAWLHVRYLGYIEPGGVVSAGDR